MRIVPLMLLLVACGGSSPQTLSPVAVDAETLAATPIGIVGPTIEVRGSYVPETHNSIAWVNLEALREAEEAAGVLEVARDYAEPQVRSLFAQPELDPFAAADEVVFSTEGFHWRWATSAHYPAGLAGRVAEWLPEGGGWFRSRELKFHRIPDARATVMLPSARTMVMMSPGQVDVVARTTPREVHPEDPEAVFEWNFALTDEERVPDAIRPETMQTSVRVDALPVGGRGFVVHTKLRYDDLASAQVAATELSRMKQQMLSRPMIRLFGLHGLIRSIVVEEHEQEVHVRAWLLPHQARMILGVALRSLRPPPQ